MRTYRGWHSWLYVGPALAILLVFLVYPTLQTIALSFFDADSVSFVGIENYAYIVGAKEMQEALRNNLLWLVLFPLLTVGIGLAIAVLADRVSYETAAKTVIFVPMAISFVAAGVIWKFIYEFRPAGFAQIGLLNAGWIAVGGQPQAWLASPPLNNLALIVVGVWMWTGFAMVILSAALKGIPRELLEAARVDGASEFQVFRSVIVPSMTTTIVVVLTTMVINALKVFDMVYVMTSGNFGTEVIANRMYKEMFNYHHFGRASAIAVVLLVAIIPIMLMNVRRFRRESSGS